MGAWGNRWGNRWGGRWGAIGVVVAVVSSGGMITNWDEIRDRIEGQDREVIEFIMIVVVMDIL